MEISLRENIVTDGLVLHLDSWNSSSYSGSGSTWIDLSGNGNNASLVGGYSYNDKSLSYVDSGYANITDTSDFDFSGDFSLESWFYLTETPNATYPSAIFASWASAFTSNDKIILFINSSGQIVFQINTGTNTLIYPSTVSLNEWYHIVVSRVNGVIDIYLNGQRGTSLNYSSPVTPVLDMRIGAYAYNSDPLGQSFVGKIPVARIYKDKGLTKKEVQQNYINQEGRFFGQNNLIIDGNNLVLSSDGIPVNIPNSGMIFSSLAWSSSPADTSFLNPNETSSEFYEDNYSTIVPYQETDLLYAYTIGTLNGTNRHNTGDRSITTPGPHIFPYFNLNWTLELGARNGCWDFDKCNASIEFLNEFDICVFAIKTVSGNNYSYFHRLYYGANLNSLTNTGISGQYPQTQGNITFTSTSATFTNTRTTNYNSNFTFNCDMLSVRKIRISNITTEASYNLTVSSAPNPCSAYVYLKII